MSGGERVCRHFFLISIKIQCVLCPFKTQTSSILPVIQPFMKILWITKCEEFNFSHSLTSNILFIRGCTEAVWAGRDGLCMPGILVSRRRQTQEKHFTFQVSLCPGHHEVQANLGWRVRQCLKKKKKSKPFTTTHSLRVNLPMQLMRSRGIS